MNPKIERPHKAWESQGGPEKVTFRGHKTIEDTAQHGWSQGKKIGFISAVRTIQFGPHCPPIYEMTLEVFNRHGAVVKTVSGRINPERFPAWRNCLSGGWISGFNCKKRRLLPHGPVQRIPGPVFKRREVA